MHFSKVALLSALAHGIGCGAAMSVPQHHSHLLPVFHEPSPSKSKQNKLSQKKRRLIKRRLGHK